MKSSFWVICGVTLLCFGSVKCSRPFTDNDENFLDKTGDQDEERTFKEEDKEWELYKARTTWNDLTNVLSKFSAMQHKEDPVADVCDAASCFNGGLCEDDDGKSVCKCINDFKGDKCEIFPEVECKKVNEKCATTKGQCISVDTNNVNCKCPKDTSFVQNEGCKNLCEDVTCFNGECKPEDGKCKCETGFSGEKCEIFPKDKCKDKIKECDDTEGTCKSVDTKDNVQCECPPGKVFRDTEGCKDLCEEVICFNGKCKPEDGKCVCDTGFTGAKCQIFPNDKCKEKLKICADTGGKCISKVGVSISDNVRCQCPEKKMFTKTEGCKDLCEGVTCFNGKCNFYFGKCDCNTGFTGEKCEIFPNDKCKEKLENCANTGGTCISVDANDNVQCKCPGNKIFTKNEGCKDLCDGVTCFNGQCKPEDGTCVCDTGFSGKKCEIFSKEKCKEKIEKCAETEGTCKSVKGKDDVQCECSDGKTFTGTEGCKVASVCDGVTCFNGGSCEDEDDEPFCNCINEFTGDKCEIFPEDECKKINEKCATTEGQCISVDTKNVTCKCPEDTSFVQNEGCRNLCENVTCYNEGSCEQKGGIVTCKCDGGFTGNLCEKFPKDKCEEKVEKCVETNGTCISVDKDTVKCKCRRGFTFVEDHGCLKTEDANCKEVCGDSSEVKCGGNKKIKEKITCTCKKDTDAFDQEDKECKINYCKKKCGDVECIGNKFVEDDNDCKCPENHDFDDKEKICKINYCKKVCGEADGVVCSAEGDDVYKIKTPQCSCESDDYLFKEKKCIEKCVKNEDCKYNGTCVGKEGEKLCKCRGGLTGDKCEIIEACGKGGKLENCTDERGTCVFKNGTAVCECNDDSKKPFDVLGYCEVECEDNEICDENRECNTTQKFCQCIKGLEGFDCDIVTGCKDLKPICDKIGKKSCVYDKDAPKLATCECEDDYKYNPKAENCGLPCSKEGKCEGNRVCNADKFCDCKGGYEGDDCNVITGCKVLEKKCEEISSKCIFDDENNNATCECKKGFRYDPKENKCQPEFCYPYNPCPETANCTFDESADAAHCQCPNNQYYSHATKKCEAFTDKCLLRKTPCGEHYECKDGECKCKYKLGEDKSCKPKYCDSNPCFTGGKCKDTDGSCYCEDGKYFNGKTCAVPDGKCVLKEYKTNCTCPDGTERKEGSNECVHKKEEEKCNTDCGHGICVKKGKVESCKCFKFAESVGGSKCFVKPSYCASTTSTGELQKNITKCKCEGKYKQADDGITCIPKTCEDADVQKECAAKGGACKMYWKKGIYDCDCPDGYEKDENGKCTDPCSIEDNIKDCAKQGKFCYNSYSGKNKASHTCKCPPTIKDGRGVCSAKAEYSYLIKNIPVLKEKYKQKSGINKVLLNKDLIMSLEQTFASQLFDYGYLYNYNVKGDIVYSSAWINFESAPGETELNKIKKAATEISNLCEDCADATVWPPNLLLQAEGLTKVEVAKQNFCDVKDRLCGKGATCIEDKEKGESKCFCDEGYKLIEYSVKTIGPNEVQRCEDIDECAEGTHTCPESTHCRNTFGNYSCVCKANLKKKEEPKDPETDKTECVDLCTNSPCKEGKCVLKEEGKTFDCQCKPGYGGSFCNREDENYKSAKHSTVVVGAVLGTILAVGAIAVLYYIIKKKKRSGSEDFMPAARMDHAEMTERRHMRGVTNKAYE